MWSPCIEPELVAESVAVVAIAAIDAIVAAFYDAFAVVAVPVAVDVAEFAPNHTAPTQRYLEYHNHDLQMKNKC